MSDPEIGALRAKLAARPRSDDYRQRRKDIDQRGLAYRLATDIGDRAGDRERRAGGMDDDTERRA